MIARAWRRATAAGTAPPRGSTTNAVPPTRRLDHAIAVPVRRGPPKRRAGSSASRA